MNDQLNDLDQMDLTFEVSDEMLETAAGVGEWKAEGIHAFILFWSIYLPGLTRREL